MTLALLSNSVRNYQKPVSDRQLQCFAIQGQSAIN